MAKETEKGTAAKAPKGAKSGKGSEASAPAGTPRLRKRYREEVIDSLMKEFSYANCMQVPHLEKITLNMGLGEAVGNPNMVKTSLEELAVIAGQKPVACKSKKAIANFKLRAGLAIGAMVTLRGDRMWEFLDRLVSVALPRVRDFKGVRKNLDGHGNYTLGLTEQYIFPEINYDKVEKVKGINVTITTSAKTDEEGKALLKHLGMPFRA